jgi:hypothetical protein
LLVVLFLFLCHRRPRQISLPPPFPIIADCSDHSDCFRSLVTKKSNLYLSPRVQLVKFLLPGLIGILQKKNIESIATLQTEGHRVWLRALFRLFSLLRSLVENSPIDLLLLVAIDSSKKKETSARPLARPQTSSVVKRELPR